MAESNIPYVSESLRSRMVPGYQVPVPGTVAIVVQTWWLMSKINFYYVPVPGTALVLPVLRSNLLNVIHMTTGNPSSM